ncbi:DUF262 domain-containing protein [Myxococcus sp. AM009]|uniref:DUF262 domain-containing protein n=1 Tax=Myxococcus sp. AM009 TaxID=2745137 RepID=UPI001595BF16|nr:DUF262 domain-containing protein [Myxococcus sp. AM009]NVI98470.1 DUF262 domain-containing protein [Myxococcus sp. AM009]
MRPSKLSLVEMFEKQRRYVVPLFQRPYVWVQDEQWEPLWQDITGRADSILEREARGTRSDRIENHFLGAVVLNQIRVYGKEVDAVEVIDGQQRLTTLQLLLAAFRDVVKGTEERRLVDDLTRLTENSGVLASEIERFKVWPTNADRRDFEAALVAGSVADLEAKYPLQRRKYARKFDPRPRLVETYLFFSRRVSEFCSVAPEGAPENAETPALPTFSADRAYALFEALKRHIQLVVIELEDDDDPQVIFETLNARGVPLLPSDLIRNFVFLKATQQGESAEDLYNAHWKEYDERPAEAGAGKNEHFWKLEERQGRVKRPRLDLFMHHYVQYRSAQDLSIGHLFQAFRSWWGAKAKRSVSAELKELRRHSDVFANVLVPDGNGRTALFAKRLQALDTSTVYPVLLLLLVGGKDRVVAGDLDGIVTDLESYLVRRMVCDLGTKNYNRFFLSMLQKLRGSTGPISRATVQQMMLAPDGSAGEWPDDKKFAKAWLEKPLYETLKPMRCSMLLEALDRAMLTSKQEAVTINGKLTVEHVLPQQWAPPAWPELPAEAGNDDETAIERRGRLLHAIGNLTLLTQELNSSVSNGPFATKRPEIAKQSVLRLNTYFQDVTTWDEAEIVKRGEMLLEVAKRIWPRPTAA